MINIDDRLLDELDAKELYLLCQITRHAGSQMKAWPSTRRLAELTGWSRTTVIKKLEALEGKKAVSIQRERRSDGTNKPNIYTVQTDLVGVWITAKSCNPGGGTKIEPGVVQKLDQGGTEIGPEVLTNEVLIDNVGKPDSPSSESIPFAQVVDYLNDKTGRSFRASSKKTKSLIRARWRDGFRLEDFKQVIDGRCSAWLLDPKMSEYLRPETMFGTKFEGYLNAAEKYPDINAIGDLTNCELSEEQATRYLDYYQWVKDKYPTIYQRCRMLTAAQHITVRRRGRAAGMVTKRIQLSFVETHDRIEQGLKGGRSFVDVNTELEHTFRQFARTYA